MLFKYLLFSEKVLKVSLCKYSLKKSPILHHKLVIFFKQLFIIKSIL